MLDSKHKEILETGEVASCSWDSVVEWFDNGIESMVSTKAYSQAYDCVTKMAEKVTSTDFYHKVAEKAEPYVMSTWEKISDSALYYNVVEKLTPAKEE